MNELVDLYENKMLSIIAISKRTGIPRDTIRTRLHRLGVKLRPKGRYKTYNFNEEFFANPNLLNSYWAGFIAADFGLCRHRGKRKCSELSCSLAKKDKKQLERFMSDIGHFSPVRVRQRTRNGTKVFTAEISITSSKMLDDLQNNFNVCAGNKIKRLCPPNLTRECRLSFIVGYIDGDGWLQYKKYLNLGVCGTCEMVTWIKDSLDNELSKVGIKGYTGKVVNRNNLSVWRANIHSWYLAELLDGIPVVKLSRKIPRIHEYKELHKGRFRRSDKCPL